MRNIMLSIEYDGGRYSGWQRLGKSESNNSIENKIIEVNLCDKYQKMVPIAKKILFTMRDNFLQCGKP